jgi:hypothetical protein
VSIINGISLVAHCFLFCLFEFVTFRRIMVDSFCGVDTQGYFGLYDGHGGRATVDFVVKALHIVRITLIGTGAG